MYDPKEKARPIRSCHWLAAEDRHTGEAAARNGARPLPAVCCVVTSAPAMDVGAASALPSGVFCPTPKIDYWSACSPGYGQCTV
jgi:hypothetical protein